MKVNIISNFKARTGLMHDVHVLRGIFSAVFGEDVQFFRVHYMLPECPDADVNVFMEVISPSLFPYAGHNIWIPNPEWTYKTWIPYISSVEVWAKTTECYDIFKQYTSNIKKIGWTSIDKHWVPETDKKNYYKAIVPVGKNIYRHPKPVLQAYQRLLQETPALYRKLPTLHIPYSDTDIQITVPEDIKSKVVLYPKSMSENEYDELFKECGLCICVSLTEGFGHAVNEGLSAGCNVLISPIRPFLEDVVGPEQIGVFYSRESRKVPQPDCLGTLIDSDVRSIMEALEAYVDSDFRSKRVGSQNCRELYGAHHQAFVDGMKSMLPTLNIQPYSLKNTLPVEDSLPDVSIVMLTKDRRVFMPLAKYSYMIQSYPESKMELVIVDDGDDPIEDTLFGVPNVRYIRCDTKMTISQKRNLGVREAMYDIVAFMDDDDVYPNNSILHRTAMMLKEPRKDCAFCTTIPCYDIATYSSFMNVPPMTLEQSKRVSEATLVFTKKFWEERGFQDDVQIGEADAFIHGREQMCRELSPQDVIVSLVHPKNTSARRTPMMKEPNGNHYGFNEKLFAMVSQIGEELKEASETKQTA
jgi:hypothetical protein